MASRLTHRAGSGICNKSPHEILQVGYIQGLLDNYQKQFEKNSPERSDGRELNKKLDAMNEEVYNKVFSQPCIAELKNALIIIQATSDSTRSIKEVSFYVKRARKITIEEYEVLKKALKKMQS